MVEEECETRSQREPPPQERRGRTTTREALRDLRWEMENRVCHHGRFEGDVTSTSADACSRDECTYRAVACEVQCVEIGSWAL